jgi:hypothetical protein
MLNKREYKYMYWYWMNKLSRMGEESSAHLPRNEVRTSDCTGASLAIVMAPSALQIQLELRVVGAADLSLSWSTLSVYLSR